RPRPRPAWRRRSSPRSAAPPRAARGRCRRADVPAAAPRPTPCRCCRSGSPDRAHGDGCNAGRCRARRPRTPGRTDRTGAAPAHRRGPRRGWPAPAAGVPTTGWGASRVMTLASATPFARRRTPAEAGVRVTAMLPRSEGDAPAVDVTAVAVVHVPHPQLPGAVERLAGEVDGVGRDHVVGAVAAAGVLQA